MIWWPYLAADDRSAFVGVGGSPLVFPDGCAIEGGGAQERAPVIAVANPQGASAHFEHLLQQDIGSGSGHGLRTNSTLLIAFVNHAGLTFDNTRPRRLGQPFRQTRPAVRVAAKKKNIGRTAHDDAACGHRSSKATLVTTSQFCVGVSVVCRSSARWALRLARVGREDRSKKKRFNANPPRRGGPSRARVVIGHRFGHWRRCWNRRRLLALGGCSDNI